MEIDGARVLVAGGTGVLGAAIAEELARSGARPVIAGRDRERLARTARALAGAPTLLFDAYDLGSCAWAVHEAGVGPDGLDAVVAAFGTVAFGTADEVGDVIAEHLMTVNFLAPAAFLRAGLGIMRPGSVIAAVTGTVAERPQARMADYSASKAALGAWLAAVRREARGIGIRVLEIRPGHLNTGFADRSVSGTAPMMPAGGDPRQVAAAVAEALATDAELVRLAPDGAHVVVRRSR